MINQGGKTKIIFRIQCQKGDQRSSYYIVCNLYYFALRNPKDYSALWQAHKTLISTSFCSVAVYYPFRAHWKV